jgi:hypothetical protein
MLNEYKQPSPQRFEKIYVFPAIYLIIFHRIFVQRSLGIVWIRCQFYE